MYWMHLIVSSFVFGMVLYLNDQLRMAWRVIAGSTAR